LRFGQKRRGLTVKVNQPLAAVVIVS